MEKISAYIIAYNEEEKIAAAIASVSWADEIIVADSHSKDRTAQIAAQLGARVVQIDVEGFGALRNSALAACSHPWVFSLDADERCTPETAKELRQVVSRNDHDLYFVPRRNFFLGREIRHSGWYPNYRQPQLFRKGRMTYEPSQVHEGFIGAAPYEWDTALPAGAIGNVQFFARATDDAGHSTDSAAVSVRAVP